MTGRRDRPGNTEWPLCGTRSSDGCDHTFTHSWHTSLAAISAAMQPSSQRLLNGRGPDCWLQPLLTRDFANGCWLTPRLQGPEPSRFWPLHHRPVRAAGHRSPPRVALTVGGTLLVPADAQASAPVGSVAAGSSGGATRLDAAEGAGPLVGGPSPTRPPIALHLLLIGTGAPRRRRHRRKQRNPRAI